MKLPDVCVCNARLQALESSYMMQENKEKKTSSVGT